MPTRPKASPLRDDEPGVRQTRKQVGAARRAEIVDAYIECVRRLGRHGTSVDQVAKAAGVSRTLIFHYFSDMASLTRAAVQKMASNAERDMSSVTRGLSGRTREQALIDFVFGGAHFASLSDVVLVAEMFSLAGRDPEVRTVLSQTFEEQIQAKEVELAASFPDADPQNRRAVAYAIMCLSEMHWFLSFLGVGAKNEAGGRMAVEALFGLLRPPRDVAAGDAA